MGSVNLGEQMARACARGAGGDPEELRELIERGEAALISLGHASASWRKIGPGAVEVLHVYGSMKDVETLHALAARCGVLRYEWEGRASWGRALQRLERVMQEG